jgi:ribosomal protein S18 acetylase RimI-like enzyme
MGIKIRKATSEDAELLAWAIMESSRSGKSAGVFDLIFQTSDDAALLDALQKLTATETKSYCHFSNFSVAEVGGEVAGVLCSYEPRIAPREIFSKALAEVGADEGYEERIAGYLLCEPDIDRQTWVLDFLVEKPGHESFEIFKELVQKSLLTARLKGYRKVQTMVEIGSLQSQMIYEKLGFKFEDEKRSEYYKELFGRAGIMRYSLAL